MDELRDLYQEIILDHNKSPRNFRAIEGATYRLEGYNPLCGDRYTLYVLMDGDVVKDISFEGAGCAISKASASVMSSLVKGKTRQETEVLFERFHDLLTSSEEITPEATEKLGKLAAFAGVRDFPMRVKCAVLAWHTMHSAMNGKEETVVTEND
jgi:nitrogen fixation NifU-like protein